MGERKGQREMERMRKGDGERRKNEGVREGE